MKREIHRALPLLLSACALTATATAQDSTSLLNTLPGDALDQTSTTEQVNNFVLDLGALHSSSGRIYGVAPLSKASWDFSTPNFFTGSVSAQTISRATHEAVPFVRSSYMQWDAPGSGINGDTMRNNPGTPVDTSAAVGNQFGFGFTQFSSDDPLNPLTSFNSAVGGTVNYDPLLPSRLYVSRIQAANNDQTWQCDISQIGMGAVDADGWLTLRVDGFGSTSCGGFSTPTGNNWLLINMLSRTANQVNIVHNAGASDTGVWVLQNSMTTHSPASMIPSAVTGGTPIMLGSNFNSQYVYGDTSPPTATLGHQAPGVADQRGLVSYCAESFPGVFGAASTHGSAAGLGIGSGTDTLNTWGLSSTGAPINPKGLTYPGNAAISDPTTGFQPTGIASFGNYFSATAFRGGTGQVAVGKDQAGRLLAAGMMLYGSPIIPTGTDNQIVVARTSNGTSVEWVVAAYTSGSGGKPVMGAFGSTQVGTLSGFDASNPNPSGPSISCPMIDSVGNVYFNSRVLMNGGSGYQDSLVRAVYDASTFSYTLEMVITEGDIVLGGNSNTRYQVDFLSISTNTGITPSAPFSQNMNQSTFNGANVAGLDPASTEALGGIVISATVTYDTDGDGDFERQATFPTSGDQDYQTLLYITTAKDCNNNGVPDDLDIADGTSADGDGDGIPDECGAGIPFCLGDGTEVNCPCGNFGTVGQGCANSTGVGSTLFSTGTASVSADDLGFDGVTLPAGKPSLLFVGTAATTAILGDGVRCVGGSIQRYHVITSSAQGTASWGPGLQAVGGYGSGDTRYFQIWYRDPQGGPCGVGFNLSSALQVDFLP